MAGPSERPVETAAARSIYGKSTAREFLTIGHNQSVDRVIAPNEAAVVRWLLDNAAVGDITAYRLHPVEELRVHEGCKCGCASLDFQANAWGGAKIIADAFAVDSDGQQAGLILWGRDGEISLLEVYDCHPNASHRFPEITDLRSFANG